MDRTALSFSRPASSLDSMEGRQSQYFHSDGPPDDLFYRAEMRFGATPFAYRSKKIKRAVRGQKQLVARRCQVRRARLNSARPLPSKVRPKLPECSHQALDVLGLSGMDDIQIEGRDGCSLQDRRDSTDHDEIHLVCRENLENRRSQASVSSPRSLRIDHRFD